MTLKKLVLAFTVILTSCQIENQNRDQEAISLVQQRKFGLKNATKISMLILLRNPNPTNMEVANMMAEDASSAKFEWKAKRLEENTYCVVFTDKSMEHLLAWEVNFESRVVLCIPCDPTLVIKYKRFAMH